MTVERLTQSLDETGLKMKISQEFWLWASVAAAATSIVAAELWGLQGAIQLTPVVGLTVAVLLGLGLLLHFRVLRPNRRMIAEVEQLAAGGFPKDSQLCPALQPVAARIMELDAGGKDHAFHASAFENTTTRLMRLDTDRNVVGANKSCRAFLEEHASVLASGGLHSDVDSLVGVPLERMTPSAQEANAALDRSKGTPQIVEFEVAGKHYRQTFIEIQNVEGDVIGSFVGWEDITQDHLALPFKNAVDQCTLITHIGLDGRIDFVSPGFDKLLGEEAQALVGQQAQSFLALEDDRAESFAERLLSKSETSGLFKLTSKSGKTHWLQGGLAPVVAANGSIHSMLFFALDCTAWHEQMEDQRFESVESGSAQKQVVEALQTALEAIAKGDLKASITTAFPPAYEPLRERFNNALASLDATVAEVVFRSGSINSVSDQIADVTSELSNRTERQASTLSETAAAIEELTASVKSTSERADTANTVVEEARDEARRSDEVVEQAVSAMGKIEESSAQIRKIISVIDDIAFQTNLLALNAGVEAARAGDAGRGFAVVASEVRALAQRSSDAAREIGGLISSSGEHVNKGVDLVGQTGVVLKSIVKGVTDIAGHMAEIAHSAREQSTGLGEINNSMVQLDQVRQENVEMFKKTDSVRQALRADAAALSDATRHFQAGDPKPIARDMPRDPVQAKAPVRPESVIVEPKDVPTPMQQVANGPMVLSSEADVGWEEF